MGSIVTIDHDDGTTIVYGNLAPKDIRVQLNERIRQGQRLGVMGYEHGTECWRRQFWFGVSDKDAKYIWVPFQDAKTKDGL